MSRVIEKYTVNLLLALAVFTAPVNLFAQIAFVETTGSANFDSVTLQRVAITRGTETPTLTTSDLISGTVTAVNIPGNSIAILSADGFPATGAPSAFLNSPVLNRGLRDMPSGDGTFVSGDQFIEFSFNSSVYNDVGADLLLAFITLTIDQGAFETQPVAYWLSADGGTPALIDRDGDFDLSPVASIPAFSFRNVALTDPSDFLLAPATHVGGLGVDTVLPRPTLQLVDLSELGIEFGDSIDSIRIWDAGPDSSSSDNLTYIAGLPPVTLMPNILLGDVDQSGIVDFGDIPAFIQVLIGGEFQAEADCNEDSFVDFADIPAFIAILQS